MSGVSVLKNNIIMSLLSEALELHAGGICKHLAQVSFEKRYALVLKFFEIALNLESSFLNEISPEKQQALEQFIKLLSRSVLGFGSDNEDLVTQAEEMRHWAGLRVEDGDAIGNWEILLGVRYSLNGFNQISVVDVINAIDMSYNFVCMRRVLSKLEVETSEELVLELERDDSVCAKCVSLQITCLNELII